MLRLLIGRSGSGKSAAILNEICELAGDDRPRQLLLVPEQYSHESERRLCKIGGNSISLHAEVLSFTRLANRVFASAGGLADRYLDDGGRLLMMNAALEAVSGGLKVYARPSQKPEFLSGLIATVDEFKSYGVSPEAVAAAAGGVKGALAEKLADLSLIYGAYAAMTSHDIADPRDRLTKLADSIEECDYADGIDIYIDGFTDFTPQEERVIERLLIRAERVTVALTCDGLEEGGNAEVFSPARKTAARLLAMAGRRRIACKADVMDGENARICPALAHLERCFFAEEQEVFPDRQQAVALFEANTAFSEVEYAASQILALVREKGYRYREIGVCARNFADYAVAVESVFERYGVPVFLNEMSDILQKPVLTLIVSALETVSGGYEYDDLFRYLKTGLAGLTLPECDLLENYVLKWDIRGGMWTKDRQWTMNPGGYGAVMGERELEILTRVNELRARVRAPLAALGENAAERRTAREQAFSLYHFMEQIGLAKRLEEKTALFTQRGQRKLAEEYGQLWDILCTALDQSVDILSDMPMELDQFTRLFKLVLSRYHVGTIPISLDRVTAGDATRMTHKDIKCLFVLGATDGVMPMVTSADGLLSDDDRKALTELGLTLAPTSVEKLDREMHIIYTAFTLPSEGLFVSYPLESAGGEQLRPSFVMGRLKTIFGDGQLTRETELRGRFRTAAVLPCLDYLALELSARGAPRWFEERPEYAQILMELRRAAAFTRGRLSPDAVQALYGEKVRMSASRVDKYQTCHFAYFMQYGLKVKARTPAGFEAPEVGTFLHYVLEHVICEGLNAGGFERMDQDGLRRLTEKTIDRYVSEVLGDFEDKTARFRYLFSRLSKTVYAVVENVTAELNASEFKPMGFELRFGEGGALPPIEIESGGTTVSVSGFVDRVDGWVRGDKLYLRVMDYKTGRKSFDLTEIWHGLGMQMLLYLFALEKSGKTLYGKEIVPAGVLYLPARDVILQEERGISDEERIKKRDKALTRSGILLDDPEMLEAMEHGALESARYLPIRISRGGEILGGAVAGRAQFEMLRRHIDKLMGQIALQVRSGKISADPYYRNAQQSACDFCEFADACHFDESCGEDKRRYLNPVKGQEFWTGLEEGAEQ